MKKRNWLATAVAAAFLLFVIVELILIPIGG